MAVSDLWALELLLAAFAGGVFGASVGALPAFTVTGVLVVVGELYDLGRETLATGAPELALTGSVAFGPVFGPHVSFGGGAAAVAYAAKKGYIDTGFDYHEAKNVTRGLGTKVDVLLVGGVFGVAGHLLKTISALAMPWDPVAFGVVASALLHRAVFGYSLFGTRSGFLDMSPFERGETRFIADGGEERHAVEPWLPYQYKWAGVSLLGLAFGALGAYLTYMTASVFLGFGVSVLLLVYVNSDVAQIPVTHHMTLPAGFAVVAAAGGGVATPTALAAALPLWQAVVLGAGTGLFGALAGEVSQRVLYAHADTHLDPPAASIVVTTLVVSLLAMTPILGDPNVLPDPSWLN
ncbi:hypothetical protein [Haloarchaeobius sp. HME9146]|uniref:hypothetical protein n=1 Tax=Haloarchaeobius sp. HME9146 TaxID=2978732 RepID=UPI0021C07CCD|nr:hypothetical protein [Haloarchaeobius sp. HME9146]MCT9095555.1 hypothetical protein [Haloarchaeobius sp. HME9146]